MATHQPGNATASSINPNALHEHHCGKRGPRNIPNHVVATSTEPTPAKDPGHPYANTSHVSFKFFDQRKTNAPFGYEYYVSLPPTYSTDNGKQWPLILFLHGSGESQPKNANSNNESYGLLRHGIPKIILCYDKLKSQNESCTAAAIDVPRPPSYLRKSRPSTPQTQQADTAKAQEEMGVEVNDKSSEPVNADICTIVAESFITVSPSLNMARGYGWSAAILSALLDDIVDRYRVDSDRIHVTGFSMGGYGTWSLATYAPQRFASVMPICGGGDVKQVGSIAHIPHWIHHGDKDDIIPVEASEQMYDALQKAGAGEVEFTRYPDATHDSWTEAYNTIEVFRWMLGHKRQPKGE